MQQVILGKAGVTMTNNATLNKTAEMTKMALLVAMNCISAYLIIPLPFSMSPIALQMVVVFLTGFILTARQAFTTMLIYILIGLAGIPVFTGGSAGPGKMFGPTGGYIWGFMVAVTLIALLKGHVYNFKRYTIVGIVIGLPIVYGMGITQLNLLTGMGWKAAFLSGMLPFIPLDIVKCAGAAFLAGPITKVFYK